MGSSGDGGGGNPAMLGVGTPMPGLPVAGQDGGLDPLTRGKFQNFLPDIQADGQNPMATGLRPGMFEYRSPGSAPAADSGGEATAARDALAQVVAGAASGGGGGGGPGLNPLGGIDNSHEGGTAAGYRMQPWMQGLPHWQGSGAAGDIPNGGTNLPTNWRGRTTPAAAAAKPANQFGAADEGLNSWRETNPAYGGG